MENIIERLTDIHNQIREQIDNQDTESAHCNVDRLLCAALDALATDETRAIVDSILEAYDLIDKWYA